MQNKLLGPLALVLWAGFGSLPASADEVFEDPAGFYSVLVPSGWDLQMQDTGVTLTKDNAWVSIWHVEGSGPPEGLTEAIARSIAQSWGTFRGASANACRVSNAAGYCAWFTGVNGRGTDSVLSIAAVTGGGHGYALMMSAPQADFAGLQPAFERIGSSFAAVLPGQ